ncbi:unnamed protein product [Prunus brigantina]
MYAKCGSIEDANEMFNGMNTRDCVSLNAIISAYALHGEGNRALSLFEDMKEEGFSPDEITLLAILQACSYTGLWETGLRLFNEMESKYGAKSGIEHFACMVDLRIFQKPSIYQQKSISRLTYALENFSQCVHVIGEFDIWQVSCEMFA